MAKRAKILRPAEIGKYPGKSSLDIYLQEIQKTPLLSRKEEKKWGRRSKRGNEEAIQKLVLHNLRFGISEAKKFQNRGVPLEDLISAANEGLLAAAIKFDPEMGVKFISYAVWWVRQKIFQLLNEQGGAVRIPLNKGPEVIRISRFQQAYKKTKGVAPSVAEISNALSIPKDVVFVLTGRGNDVRLDAPLKDTKNGVALHSNFSTPNGDAGDPSSLESEDQKEFLMTLINTKLSPRHSKILILYFGLNGEEPRTLESIGQMMGITRERVRQLREKGLKTLKVYVPEHFRHECR
jgi:RNA polymerase primary sigma factor